MPVDNARYANAANALEVCTTLYGTDVHQEIKKVLMKQELVIVLHTLEHLDEVAPMKSELIKLKKFKLKGELIKNNLKLI